MEDERPAKERAEIPEVDPVVIGGIRYEVVPWGKARGLGQNGGIIAAVDAATGRELWTLKVYEIRYDPDMEGDKQDLFIAGLSADGDKHLRVEAERGGGIWRVDLERRASERVDR
jgi:hypothetical protein